MAVAALAKLGTVGLRPLMRRAAEEGNHWHRVGTSGMLEDFEAGRDPAAGVWRGVPFEVAGDYALGARMAVAGDEPWQWGLTGLCQASAENFDLCENLVSDDVELCRAWDEWMMTGNPPLEVLPRLQQIVGEGGSQGEAAVALAMDILQ